MKSAQWTIGLVVVGALAVSCNALTGLSDYEKVDCVGACGDAGMDAVLDVALDVVPDVDAGGDVAVDVADEDALEADVVDAEVSDADVVTYDAIELGPVDPKLRWARWRMPHWDPDSGDATVVEINGGFEDKVTKLKWSPSSEDPEPLPSAAGFCHHLHGRLPTRIELVSLLEFGNDASFHHPVFDDTQEGPYWTVSEVFDSSGPPEFFWVIDFNTGMLTKQKPLTYKAYARCIIN